MNTYTSIEEGIRKLKRPFVVIAFSGVLANFVVIILAVMFPLIGNKSSTSPFQICYHAMQSLLIENNPDVKLFNESVLNDTKNKTFNIDIITLVKLVGNDKCDVVTQDSKGFRSYQIKLEKSSKFKRFYRVLEVKGQKIASEYQWKDKL